MLIEDKEKKRKEQPDFSVGKQKFRAELAPPALLTARYFSNEPEGIEKFEAEVSSIDQKLEELKEEHCGEFGVMHRNLPLVSDADRQRLRAYSLEVGDFVFSRVGSIDRNALIRDTELGWLFSGRLLRVRPVKEKVFAPYLSYQFHSEAFKPKVREVAVGQTMASLNTQILNNIPVVLPSLSEQTAIATVLSDMDAEIAALEQKRDKPRLPKQGMMQELLTGRTSLVDSPASHE